jgi:amino acid transporter
MAIETQNYFRRNWKDILYFSTIFSTFIIVAIEIYFLEINHSISDTAADFINNFTYITYFTLIMFNPIYKDNKRVRLIRKSIPFAIPIYAVSIGLLYLSYNSVLNQTINEIDYINRNFIILVACFLGYGVVYGLFEIQYRRRAKKNQLPEK